MSQFVNLFMSQQPYNLKQLSKILDASYSDSTDKNAFLTKTSFSPSKVGYGSGKCPRYWVMAFQGAQFIENFESHSVDNMQTGTDRHQRIQDNFISSGIPSIVEKELKNEDPPIRGFVDLILEFNGYNIVVEIKTTRTEAFQYRKMNNKGPDYQELQLLIYLYLLNEKHGLLLYEDKNDHSKILIPVTLSEKNKEKVEKVFDWMREVYSAYKNGKLPKNNLRKNAAMCKTCPLNEWCKQQPEGDIDIQLLDYSS